jgi:hypothetical protein
MTLSFVFRRGKTILCVPFFNAVGYCTNLAIFNSNTSKLFRFQISVMNDHQLVNHDLLILPLHSLKLIQKFKLDEHDYLNIHCYDQANKHSPALLQSNAVNSNRECDRIQTCCIFMILGNLN